MPKKAAPKKDQLSQDRDALLQIMNRTDKKPEQCGLRKALIMTIRQIEDVINKK